LRAQSYNCIYFGTEGVQAERGEAPGRCHVASSHWPQAPSRRTARVCAWAGARPRSSMLFAPTQMAGRRGMQPLAAGRTTCVRGRTRGRPPDVGWPAPPGSLGSSIFRAGYCLVHAVQVRFKALGSSFPPVLYSTTLGSFQSTLQYLWSALFTARWRVGSRGMRGSSTCLLPINMRGGGKK
jgi:hypothetical protein